MLRELGNSVRCCTETRPLPMVQRTTLWAPSPENTGYRSGRPRRAARRFHATASGLRRTDTRAEQIRAGTAGRPPYPCPLRQLVARPQAIPDRERTITSGKGPAPSSRAGRTRSLAAKRGPRFQSPAALRTCGMRRPGFESCPPSWRSPIPDRRKAATAALNSAWRSAFTAWPAGRSTTRRPGTFSCA